MDENPQDKRLLLLSTAKRSGRKRGRGKHEDRLALAKFTVSASRPQDGPAGRTWHCTIERLLRRYLQV